MTLIGGLFYGGLVLALAANIVNYATGDRKKKARMVAMICGIVATFSIGFAGRIANGEVAAAAAEAHTAALEAHDAAIKADNSAKATNAVHSDGGLMVPKPGRD
jgi:hypothetical protein